MTTQHTIYAPTQADLLYLLALPEVGILVGGQPAPGVGYAYRGPWSIAGAAMASEHALVWWIDPPADEIETARREAVLQELRTRSALYEGTEHPTALLGTSGPQKPPDIEMVGILREHRLATAGVQVRGKWYHTDTRSLIYHAQNAAKAREMIAAGQPGTTPIPDPDAPSNPLAWKNMGGGYTIITCDIAIELEDAIKVQTARHFKVGEQARALIAAGTPIDIHAIQWPAGYEAAP
jgi:hypothetical protein